jgi:dipeptidyl-peptidase-4
MQEALRQLPGVDVEQAQRITNQANFTLDPERAAVIFNHENNLFYYRFGADRADRLTKTSEPQVGEEFSPDGKMVSFVRNFDIYVVDIERRREWALTTNGSATLLNGRLDWMYQEEIYGRGNFKGYWWSPDSTKLAFVSLDESEVKDFPLTDHIPPHPTLEVTKYPLAGDPNPKARLGIVNAFGGEITWVDTTKYESIDFLLVRVTWSPDSKQVVYQIQDREQRWLDLNFADSATGSCKTIIHETSDAWVGVTGDPSWIKDGSFLWLSERTGWKHAYHYAPTGDLIRAVTEGNWEVRTLLGVDESTGTIYFSGTEHDSAATHTCRVALEGGEPRRLTTRDGTHRSFFTRDFKQVIDYCTDVRTPVEVRLHDHEARTLRMIHESSANTLKGYSLGHTELLEVKTRDGFALQALMIRPPDFDPSRRYPVMSHTYSGPHAPVVSNAWGGEKYMWHQMLAQKGYIVWICDNRSASGKGIVSAWPIYRNIGELELRDLEQGVAWLRQQPYVDPDRIGIWGWSGGGYMTLYALTHSTSFKIGIAGAPVTDWRNYDSIYTERYMAMPQNNPDGYEKSSVVKAAGNLHGRLLLVHGTMDDNVHLENTIQFLYEAQKAGKQVELMIYPKSRHAITEPLLLKHLRALMTEFIVENL